MLRSLYRCVRTLGDSTDSKPTLLSLRATGPARRALRCEPLEDRRMLNASTFDFGDAPDPGVGTGPGNYITIATEGGPSHAIVPGLYMGGSVDGDDGTLQNASANADDVDQALPDDEDGLSNPIADLAITIGTQPKVNVIATNTTGAAATLSGWIDYNNDGVFDNTTERAQIAVPHGTTSGIVTLTFPTVPTGFTGETYARFRLSTDAAVFNPTGTASDGEVEDYPAAITLPSNGDIFSITKIAHETGGGPTLVKQDYFGNSVTSLGDMDGDGVTDMAVGAYGDHHDSSGIGDVHVLFMNTDGTVKSSQKISSDEGGGPPLSAGDRFGFSVSSLGDLDGDGVADLAVGAADDTGGENCGAVYVLFMNMDGTVRDARINNKNIQSDPFLQAMAESALRATLNRHCQPFKLPRDKFDRWKTMTLVFNPKEMLGG